jgi:hypothetical protein
MKTQGAHAHEDRLLDFAYGELPPSEAQAMEQHVQGCSRCSDALEGIRGIRTTMSRLPLESAPDAGLDSLLAYAQQSARRAAAGPEPAPRWWRRLLAPALGLAGLSAFGVVVLQVNREVDLSPALKKEAAQESAPRPEEVAPKDLPAAPAPTAAPVSPEVEQMHAYYDKRAQQRAKSASKKQPPKPVRRYERADWSNSGAGSAGGFPDKKVVLDDEDALGLDGFGTKEPSKSKRDVSVAQSFPSVSTARPVEPALDEAPAQAQEQGLMAEAPTPGESQAVQAAPPSSKLRIGGSSAARPTPPASVASADDYAQQAPGRAQVASAAPPPPPVAQYPLPAPAAGSLAQAEEVEVRRAEQASKSREKADTAARLSPAELMKQADEAYRSGDRAQEADLLRGALSAGAQGAQRLEALSRLCDAELALGHRQNAIDICKRVMMEGPDSSAARVARRRLERALQSPAGEADSESKAASPAKE